MARGGRVICKRAGTGGRKRRRRSKASDDDDDEDDEEYVLEEEDEEESLDELLASDGEEEEYGFGESGGSDEGEPASEFDDEDEEFLAPRSKRRRKAATSKPRKKAKKSRVSDDDDDDDYAGEEEEDEDEEEEEEHISVGKRGRSRNLAAVRSRGQKSGPSDYEERQEEENISSRNSARSRQLSTNRSGALKSGSSDYEEEEEEEVHLSSKKRERKGNHAVVRSRKQISGSSDYEEKEESESAGNRGMSLAIVRSRGQNSGSSDYEDEKEEEDDDEDVDFSLDEQDLDDEEVSKARLPQRRNPKEGRNKRKSLVSRIKKGEKRYPKGSEGEDDFIVKDHVPVNRKTKKPKKTTRKKSSTAKATRERSPVESDTSDFDFVTSDDDFMEDTTVSDGQTNKNTTIRKTNTTRTGKRKNMVLSEESESSTDDDYMISEEELRDLGVDGSLEQSQPKRVVAGRKGDEKGKEKENEELGNPLCGICLSEEQRTTVRGVLNCCTHFFCFACIMEWSKVESRCPVCKRRVETITNSSSSDPGFGLRKAVIKVEKRDQVYQPSEEEIRRMLDPYENVVCIECHQGGDDSLMLLCDICDSPAHTYCVGLGREVPEGNWYCECCRFAGDGSFFLQNQVVGTDQVANNNDFISSQIETEVAVARDSAHLQRSSQPFLHEIDLNVSPRTVEDYGSMSQPFGAGPSTLSGRRAIHQRIRILLSSSRQRQVVEETHGSHGNAASDVMISQIRQSGESLHDSQGISSSNLVSVSEECYLNNRPSFQSDVSLARCTTEGSSFRDLDGAKDQVQAMVKQHLKELSRDSSLDRATTKEIGRRSTHTILAACGIRHHRRMVSASIPPPSNCSHNQDQQIALISGCCLPCFSSYVKYVVQKILSAT